MLTLGSAPAGDIVATVYKDGSALYVEPLPPQSLTCLKPIGTVAARWRGSITVSPTSRPSSKPTPSGCTAPALDSNWVLVVGHLSALREEAGRQSLGSEVQTWLGRFGQAMPSPTLAGAPRCGRSGAGAGLLSAMNDETEPIGGRDRPMKKPQTRYEPGLPRMLVRLLDGGTSGISAGRTF